ncbi:MAG: DUF4388 domain-containing protein [Deltaproteobacteria bacterium]|nr:DUF4388 domain-containing protein [Deltaproteobacteria bacterium]
MIAGDLSTMSLADLLQWVEQAGCSGHVSLHRDGAVTWLNVSQREVTMLSPVRGGPGAGSPEDPTATDRLLDLFLERHGRFEFVPRVALEGGVPLHLPLRVVVMEGLRHLDEWPRLAEAYPRDAATLARTATPAPDRLSGVQRLILRFAESRLTLGEARLKLGVSRPALLRHVEEVRGMGLVEVEGTESGVDPVAQLLAQASVLVQERQFEEAAIVFGSLLASDPTDLRVRRLLREAEREQVAALYQQLQPVSVVRLVDPAALPSRKLSRTDREIAERVNDRWDVASLVLASPLREVETLRSIRRLWKMGIVDLDQAAMPG